MEAKLFDTTSTKYWAEERAIYSMAKYFKPSGVAQMSPRELREGLDEMVEILPFMKEDHAVGLPRVLYSMPWGGFEPQRVQRRAKRQFSGDSSLSRSHLLLQSDFSPC